MVTLIRRVQAEATMSLAIVEEGLIDQLLTELQKAGVQPGARLKIRIEEVGEQK